METNRFKQLLESTLGNVKPLISEQRVNQSSIQTVEQYVVKCLTDINNFILKTNKEQKKNVPIIKYTVKRMNVAADPSYGTRQTVEVPQYTLMINGVPAPAQLDFGVYLNNPNTFFRIWKDTLGNTDWLLKNIKDTQILPTIQNIDKKYYDLSFRATQQGNKQSPVKKP